MASISDLSVDIRRYATNSMTPLSSCRSLCYTPLPHIRSQDDSPDGFGPTSGTWRSSPLSSLVHLGAGRNDGVSPLDRDCREFPSWQLAFELSGRAPAVAASRCVALHQLRRPPSADFLGPFPSLPRTR